MSSYRKCDARYSVSHCSLIQPSWPELTPPGTHIRLMKPPAIKTIPTPTPTMMKSICCRRNQAACSNADRRRGDCLCACAHGGRSRSPRNTRNPVPQSGATVARGNRCRDVLRQSAAGRPAGCPAARTSRPGCSSPDSRQSARSYRACQPTLPERGTSGRSQERPGPRDRSSRS